MLFAPGWTVRLPTALLALTLYLSGTSTVIATPIVRFDFTGTVTELSANNGLFGAPATLGDPFSGHFSYALGLSNPDQVPADPLGGLYNALDFVIDGAFSPLTGPFFIAVARVLPVPGIFPAPDVPGAERLTVVASSPDYSISIRLTLQAPFGTTLLDDSLPSDLMLSNFTEISTVAGVETVGLNSIPTMQDVGTIRTLTRSVFEVPEPASLALLGLGLAGLALSRRKRT